MKRIIKHVLLAGAGAWLLASCYGVKAEHYPELSPIQIVAQSDTINADLGVELHYEGIAVASSLPVTYEWAYGLPAANTTVEQHQFASRTVLDTESPNIDYTFTHLGSYILRLKVDNGESIAYKFFRLNVNSGLDEGVAILDNDADGNVTIQFLKTLTAEEKIRGAQELFSVRPAEGMRNGKQLYMSSYKLSGATKDEAAFVVATDDAEGTMYLFESRTMELVRSDRMSAWGTSFSAFSGEYGGAHDFGVFFNSTDGRIFRFDLVLGYLNDIANFPEGLTHAYLARNRSTGAGATSNYPFFFGEDVLATRTTVSSGVKEYRQEGFKVGNMAMARTLGDAFPLYVLLQSKSDPQAYRIQRANRISGGTSTWATMKDENDQEVLYHYDFTSSDLKMDSQSKMVNTKCSGDVYYTYDNAIYRWSLSAPPATAPTITLPEGEQIRDIAVNYMGRSAAHDGQDPGEDLLYILTYNPARSGERKGSLYIYRFSDDTLLRSVEGIAENPVSIVYKYRVS